MNTKIIKNHLDNPNLVRPLSWDDVPRPQELLWLDKNENTDPEFRQFLLSIHDSIRKDVLFSYPETKEIYKKLARWNNVSENSIFLTHGSDGAIKNTFELFVEVDDKVLITKPSVAMYDVYAKIFGASLHTIEYKYDQKCPKIETNEIISQIKTVKPKLFCLPNPDSPTGSVIS